MEIDSASGTVAPICDAEKGNWAFVHFRSEAGREQCLNDAGNLMLQVFTIYCVCFNFFLFSEVI